MSALKVLPASEYEQLIKDYGATKHVTPPFLTKFERTAVKGIRLEQLCQGAPSVLAPDVVAKLDTFEEIVDAEMDTGKVPFILLRTLPGGEKEIRRFEDLHYSSF